MPLHLLDNLSNLTDPVSARNALGLGSGNSPQFTNVTLTGTLSANSCVLSDGLSATKVSLLSTDGELVASKNIRGWAFGSKATPTLTIDATPQGVDFKPDGSVMFVAGSTNRRIYAYNLSPAWDVSTASATPSLSTIQLDVGMEGVRFSPDGQYMFVVSSSTDTVKRYSMSVGNEWNISTITAADQTFTLPTGVPRGLCFKPDGTKMYVFDDNTNTIREYDLSPAWSVTGATQVNNVSFPDATFDIDISSDGKRLFIISSTIVSEYTLPTPWSVNGAFFNGSMYRSTAATGFPNGGPADPEATSTGLYYNDVVDKCFFVGSQKDKVQEIIVTPQPAVVGTRPIILSNPTNPHNSTVDRVTINSLQITDSTVAVATSVGALVCKGGISSEANVNAVTINGNNVQATGTDSGIFTLQFRASIRTAGSGNNGFIRLGNEAGTDFDRLIFGPFTATYPAIRKAQTGVGLDIITATNTDFADLKARNITATGPVVFPNVTVSGLAAYSGATYTGAMVYVTNELDGPTMAFYDGTNWRRVQDRAIVSEIP